MTTSKVLWDYTVAFVGEQNHEPISFQAQDHGGPTSGHIWFTKDGAVIREINASLILYISRTQSETEPISP
ncbi:MAG: hypothetical protein F4013_05865 [Gammaproteobacteria bacterium]|nr:hypothetical protein [Gammaproteobacteria bacterium]MYL01230.1 hypothetical protein [Gammaproteobacteria bacterium]